MSKTNIKLAKYEMSEEDKLSTRYSILPVKVTELDIPNRELRVLVSMCRFANREGLIFATTETIAKNTPYSYSSTEQALANLTAKGWIRSLEPVFMRGQTSVWKTARRQVLYDPDMPIPTKEELKKAVVSFNKVDEEYAAAQSEQHGEVEVIPHEIDQELWLMITRNLEVITGAFPNFQHREYERLMLLHDGRVPLDISSERVHEILSRLVKKHKGFPTLVEVFNDITTERVQERATTGEHDRNSNHTGSGSANSNE